MRTTGAHQWRSGAGAALVVVAVLVVAVSVGAVLVGTWWLTQPRSGDDAAGRSSVPGTTGAVGAGASGSTGGSPGDLGSGDPTAGTSDRPPAGQEPVLRRGMVRVDSYAVRGNRLMLNHTWGVPECYGEVVLADVREDHDAVTVSLRARPQASPAEACIDLAVLGTVAVDLAAPLGERPVLDGSFEPTQQVTQVARPYSPARED